MESKSIYYLLYLHRAAQLHSPCDPDSVPPSIVHPGAVPPQLRRAAPQVVGKLNRAVIKTFPLTNRHVNDVEWRVHYSGRAPNLNLYLFVVEGVN